MGLLGNVAEWASLRPDLMQEQYVAIFACLLRSDSDGIEVRIHNFKIKILQEILFLLRTYTKLKNFKNLF